MAGVGDLRGSRHLHDRRGIQGVFDQAYSHESGDLQVTAALKQVKSAVAGCLLAASDAVGLAAQELDPSTATRALMEEVTFWLDHQDQLDTDVSPLRPVA